MRHLSRLHVKLNFVYETASRPTFTEAVRYLLLLLLLLLFPLPLPLLLLLISSSSAHHFILTSLLSCSLSSFLLFSHICLSFIPPPLPSLLQLVDLELKDLRNIVEEDEEIFYWDTSRTL